MVFKCNFIIVFSAPTVNCFYNKKFNFDINYSNDTFIFNFLTKLWIKLKKNTNKLQERAAHTAAVDDNNVMMVYGGSTKNRGLAEDEI